MPMYDYKYLLLSAAALGNGGDEYAYTAKGNVINFGQTTPGEVQGGKFGLHCVLTTAYAGTMTTCEIWVVTGSGATPTTKLVGRYFAVADMTVGRHIYIAFPPTGILQYASMWIDVAGTPDAGAMTAWFGPDEDGAT